jgi:hypothetical protein
MRMIFPNKKRSNTMKKHPLLVTVLLIAALLSITSPVAASTPADVTIVSIMHPQPNDPIAPFSGTFVASGPAVDAGLLCGEGDVQDIVNPARGWQSSQVITLYVHKHFMCSDGSGSFEMNMQVLIAPTRSTARWNITAGEGSYTRLFGAGGLTAVWLSEYDLEDTYFGKLHIE